MPDVQVPAWTVGQAVDIYRRSCTALGADQYYINAISPPTLGDYLGYRTVEFEVTSYEIVSLVRIVVLCLPSGATLPMRYVTADPQWNGTLKTEYHVPSETGLDWGFQEAAWNLRVPELKKLIAAAWCGATVAHEHRENVLNLALNEGVSLWTATLATGSAFFPAWEALVSFNRPDTGPIWQDFGTLEPPGFEAGSVSIAPGSAAQIVGELGKITEVLRDIATVDVTTSINNGAAAWSVKGRIGAGE